MINNKQVSNNMKKARRALDSLEKVVILDDWQYDEEEKKWFLHICIHIEKNTEYIPAKSQWYVVVETEYPQGNIKVFPDVENSIITTFFHQANNSLICKNKKWRMGALCLDENIIKEFREEPIGSDERLLYYVLRAINWIELASKNKLVKEGDAFELPDFKEHKIDGTKFIFSEDIVTYMQWESIECKYGTAEIVHYKENPYIYYVKKYNSLKSKECNYVDWGKELSYKNTGDSSIGLWILLKEVPKIGKWQAPNTLEELLQTGKNQGIDIWEILKELTHKIRDGMHHILLIGFPIPQKFGDNAEIIFWKALVLPIVSFGTLTEKGFRTNEIGRIKRDRKKILKENMELKWLPSENWNKQEISQRGKLYNQMQRKRFLIIGAGCVGASISELLIRQGVSELTISDSDIFEVGNLSRHTLSMNSIGLNKGIELAKHLNKIAPHANVNATDSLLNVNSRINIDLNKYDIIIDCSASKDVLEIISNYEFKKQTICATISLSLGAQKVYLGICNEKIISFDELYKLIYKHIEEDKNIMDTYSLPRDGTGCWSPTFPGRADDVWLSTAVSVKVIENYIKSASKNQYAVVYGQKQNNGKFQEFGVIEEYGKFDI